MGHPSLTPSAVVLLAAYVASEYAHQTGAQVSRRSWVRQALIDELVRLLPTGGGAARSIRRLVTEGRGVTESVADDVFLDLAAGGWLAPSGLYADATWTVQNDRRDDIVGLWSALTKEEQNAIQRAAQRTVAVSVAWSKKARTGSEPRSSTSRSSMP
jgi:hypothetical protein